MANAFQTETEYEFVAHLPGGRGRPSKRKPFVAALKARPGEWAVYPMAKGTSANTAAATSSTLKRDFPGVETACRAGKVYARWVGKAAKGGAR